MNLEPIGVEVPARNPYNPTDRAIAINPQAVLTELVQLLEAYAPVWYTEEHHNRAMAALASMR